MVSERKKATLLTENRLKTMEKVDERASNGANNLTPELRCKRNCKGWQCSERRLEEHTLCRKHYIQRQLEVMRRVEKKIHKKKRRTNSMVSLPQQEQNPAQNGFMEGQEVEVASQDQGFEDSWFIATVVHPPSNDNTNNKNKYLVEYHSLEDEDGVNPLREYVDVSHLRPLQPSGTTTTPTTLFKPDQVVDAFVNDGWWKGVISKVIEEDSRYSVFFRLTAEEIEFQKLELRLHMEWIDGKWVTASQTQETGAVLQNDVSFLSPNPTESSAHRTDMDTSQSPNGVRDIMWEDVQSISRSTCGRLDDQSTTNKTDSPSYVVLSSLKNTKQTDAKGDAEVLESLKKGREEAEEVLSFSTTKLKRKCSEVSGLPKPHVQFQKEQHVVLPTKQMKEPLLGTEIELQEIEGVGNERENVTISKRGRPKGSGKNSKRGRPKGSDKKHEKESSKSQNLAMTLRPRGRENKSTNKKSTNVPTDFTQLQSCIVGGDQTLCMVLDKRDAPSVECHGDTEDEAINNNLMFAQMDCRVLNPTIEEHQTLSLCLENSNIQVVNATEDERNPQSSVDVTLNIYSSVGQQDEGSTTLEKASLPFTKNSDMWETIESNEVFKLIPQSPHFLPLKNENEELREMAALGKMMTYIILMERTCKARLDDPRSMFETRVKALTDLENYGFTVQPIRSRLEEMLKIKDSCSQLDNKKTTEREILEEKRQFDKIQESITQLNTQLQVLLEEKENKSSKLAELQRRSNEIDENIQGASRDFQRVVAASWK